MTNAITSLRIQKTRAEADLDILKEKQANGSLAKSPEIQSAVAKDPGVAKLREAILQSKITALGDRGNKQFLTIQKELNVMLVDRQKAATGEAIKLKSSKLKTEVASISEKLLAIGNQYNEASERLRDLSASLVKIANIQSDINRLKQQAGKLEAELLRLRISMGNSPLAIHAPAEIR